MLFGYELKKILKRIKPSILILLVIMIAATTTIMTAMLFNHQPVMPDYRNDYQELQTRIQNWDAPRQTQIKNSYDEFYKKYCQLNASTAGADDIVVKNYQQASNAFQTFYNHYEQFIYHNNENQIASYLLVQPQYIDKLNDLMNQLKKFLIDDSDTKTHQTIIKELEINQTWSDYTIPNILENIGVQTLDDADLAILGKHFAKYPAGQNNYNCNDAYTWASNQYWLALESSGTYTGNLHDYFPDFVDTETSKQNVAAAAYRLDNPDQDFANAFVFGNIYNTTGQISLLDFMFTNLEMATIPFLIIVMILATCAFFTDTYRNTIITTIATTRKRSSVIITKSLVTFVLSVLTLLGLTLVYLASGMLFFNPCLSPDILFFFNGNTLAILSPVNYFVLYLISLVWQILPYIALCGLFSFCKGKPQIIIGCTVLIWVVITVCNALLGNFAFYQYVPFLGLHPMRYLGAQLLFSPTPHGASLWYTAPIVLLLTIYLYGQLIHNFRHKDF